MYFGLRNFDNCVQPKCTYLVQYVHTVVCLINCAGTASCTRRCRLSGFESDTYR
jgi:hypothetical protein